jgi:hypothetical protein
MNELTSQTNEPGERFGRAELAIPYRVLSSESGMYHLLIERVSTVSSSSSDRTKPNGYRAGCRTYWFIYIPINISI